jgi:site-specific recombinase XerD
MQLAIDWSRVLNVWRASGRTPATRAQYLYWAKRYVAFCESRRPLPAHLTHADVQRFVARGIGAERVVGTTPFSAVRALSCALEVLGHSVPPWKPTRASHEPLPLVGAFIEHRVSHQGVAARTTRSDARTASAFLSFLRKRGCTVSRLRVDAVDDFVAALARRLPPRTVAGMCSTVRAFLSFLHMSGRTRTDLAPLVASPRVRRVDRPSRALPWGDVRRILRAIDVSTGLGARDYAMFLMMAAYGMGAGEIRELKLDDVDWVVRTLHVRRPKTGTDTVLPLLDPVARALARYLRGKRPAHACSRNVFVSQRMPHAKLSGSSAIRHRLAMYAARAGVRAKFLGTHVFRHTHATRQIESGVTAKIVGDILGHRRPESTSAYVRSAIRGLRAISLPVPA